MATPSPELQQAKADMARGWPAEALKRLDRVVEIESDNAEAILLMGVCKLRLAEFGDAVPLLTRSFRLSPNAEAAYYCALALDELENSSDAIEWLEEALALKPDFDQARAKLRLFIEEQVKRAPAVPSIGKPRGELQGMVQDLMTHTVKGEPGLFSAKTTYFVTFRLQRDEGGPPIAAKLSTKEPFVNLRAGDRVAVQGDAKDGVLIVKHFRNLTTDPLRR